MWFIDKEPVKRVLTSVKAYITESYCLSEIVEWSLGSLFIVLIHDDAAARIEVTIENISWDQPSKLVYLIK